MTDHVKKPIAAALGAAFLATAMAPTAIADVNPFTASPLTSGYDLVNKGDAEGKCGEGHDKKGEGACGEGSCGAAGDKEGEGKCGEGKCGEGKCGEGHDKKGEGKCGGSA